MTPSRSELPRLSVRRLALALGLALSLVACEREPADPPLSYEGSTVLSKALLPELIAGFERKSGQRFGTVEAHGSSAGFRAVMEGRAALGGVSRSLESAERAARPYYAIVGYDASAIYVHASNPVKGLSRAQLKDVFTGKLTRWSEVGGADAPIELVYVRGSQNRITIATFADEILERAPLGPGTWCEPGSCPLYVAEHPNAVTFGSFSFRVPGTKVLEVEGMLPEPETVRTGEYLLSRPLLLVTKQAPRGNIRAFLDYVMSDDGQRLVARYFFPVREVH